MPVTLQRWLAPEPPSVAIEVAADRVTVVEVAASGRQLTAYAGEALPAGAVVPALTGPNIPAPDQVRDVLRRVLERAGLTSVRRAALVVPDSVARVSMLTFDQVPARAQDLDNLVRWQLRKSAPFPLEDAVVSHFPTGVDAGRAIIAAVVVRHDVVSQYEALCAGLGIHCGIVDLASLNVVNTILATAQPEARDWLVVHDAADATTLAIARGASLLFYRNRPKAEAESLGSLVHQTAMYHEDRLGGGGFGRVWLSGAGAAGDDLRRQIAARVDAPVAVVDFRPAAAIDGAGAPGPELLDALAAPVGVLIRDRQGAQV